MLKAFSIPPSEASLSRIETLLENVYDLVQSIREEYSQPLSLNTKIQAEIKRAKANLKQGKFTDFETPADLIAHFDALSERADAYAQKHKTI